MKKTVPYITGDGVGVEITPSMQAIVNAAVKKAYGSEHEIEWIEVLAGERAFNETGSWLPDETMEAFKKYGVGDRKSTRLNSSHNNQSRMPSSA